MENGKCGRAAENTGGAALVAASFGGRRADDVDHAEAARTVGAVVVVRAAAPSEPRIAYPVVVAAAAHDLLLAVGLRTDLAEMVGGEASVHPLPVEAPLPHIARHVVQSPVIRLAATDHGGCGGGHRRAALLGHRGVMSGTLLTAEING